MWKRTGTIAEAFRQGMLGLGLKLFSQCPANSVTAVYYPEGITDKDFRNTLKKAHNIHVAGGQGTMEGKIFRVNHMGYTDAYDCLAAVAGVEFTLKKLGYNVQIGAGVAAAQKVLAVLYGEGRCSDSRNPFCLARLILVACLDFLRHDRRWPPCGLFAGLH